MRTIDADALERDGWQMSRTVRVSKDVMEIQTRKPTDFPIIEPQRMRGKWIPHHDEMMLFDGMSIGGVTCSECGWKTYNKMHLLFGCPYKYCPKCGAEMREGQDEVN